MHHCSSRFTLDFICSYLLQGITKLEAYTQSIIQSSSRQASQSESNQSRGISIPSFELMANKTLRKFSAPSTKNIRTGPTLNTRNIEFELKLSLINMMQASPFSGKAHEDASTHLQNFLEISSTVTIKDIAQDIILLHLFSFSILGKAKQWFYANKDDINTWVECSNAFRAKFFPMVKPMPYEEESPTYSNKEMKPFQRHGNVFKNIF